MRFRLADHVSWAHEFDATDPTTLGRGIRDAWQAYVLHTDPRGEHPRMALRRRLAEIDAWAQERASRTDATDDARRSWRAQVAHWRYQAERKYGADHHSSPIYLHLYSPECRGWYTTDYRRPGAETVSANPSAEDLARLWAGALHMDAHLKNLSGFAGAAADLALRPDLKIVRAPELPREPDPV